MVVFINGASARDQYRKFKIRTSTNDDLKSMQEVISRRLKHPEWDFPDLIVLDGGITQVNAILPLVEPFGIPVIGRDKSGDHSRNAVVKLVIPEHSESRAFRSAPARELAPAAHGDGPAGRGPRSECLELPSGSHIARLIARIDEESHRFAITYHSSLKRKNLLK